MTGVQTCALDLIEGKVGGREKTHSAAGALWAIRALGKSHGPTGALSARVLAYLIASHHSGLYDWNEGLDVRLNLSDCHTELEESLMADPPQSVLSHGDFVPTLKTIPGGTLGFALWVRMLFSCLVDADFLDTEAHFDSAKPSRRIGFPEIGQMQVAFEAYMKSKAASAAPTIVNKIRSNVLQQCQAKATMPRGFFSLTAAS